MTFYRWLSLLIASLAMIFRARCSSRSRLSAVMLLMPLAVAGCFSIDRRAGPPSDWPELRVVVHKSGFMAQRECDGAIGGCAVPDFCSKRCDVYLQIDSPAIEAHERAHCAGYDHPGDDTMKALWANYRQMRGPRFCSLRLGIANYCALWPDDSEHCGLRISER
jgi:hypothetical protein